ncbi:hypothetical protein LEP1GSC202_0822 [Leptospira yanagawae serovar Saopaulo str. Sao Paulo = ATCC 700523]|uniref:Uncharacterized protein n=1 Tax=Leptospira yanagawae serovar Saopaulo str. Sao Paulo = ATCC 700523 TaxID=1249483 RepID=A0A5E8HCU9_9LEPT|nr:hypothetical protein LEP1GSC202_0822 [Leptospira yanagawae serovar Saopaulo str. Sao Paulo = ATCC 700523]
MYPEPPVTTTGKFSLMNFISNFRLNSNLQCEHFHSDKKTKIQFVSFYWASPDGPGFSGVRVRSRPDLPLYGKSGPSPPNPSRKDSKMHRKHTNNHEQITNAPDRSGNPLRSKDCSVEPD